MSTSLVAKIHAQRESRFEVRPGRFLRIRRPAEVEMVNLRGGLTVERLKQIVVGWEAFTEADLLGASVGSSSPVEFDAEVFAAWIADHGDDYAKTCEEVQRLVVSHFKAKEAAAKN